MRELANEPFVTGGAHWHYYTDKLIDICRKHGFSPEITQTAYMRDGIIGFVHIVETGCRLGLLHPLSCSRINNQNPLKPAENWRLHLSGAVRNHLEFSQNDTVSIPIRLPVCFPITITPKCPTKLLLFLRHQNCYSILCSLTFFVEYEICQLR